MEYCWQVIGDMFNVGDYNDIPHEERTLTLFNNLYSFMASHQEEINKLTLHNPIDGAMVHSLNIYMRKAITKMISECTYNVGYPISLNIVAEHYSNTVWMLLEQCFIASKPISKEEAIKCLDYLIGTLERKSTRS